MFTTLEAPTLTANQILNALTRDELERLSLRLEYVKMPLGKVLCVPDEPITHVYFPNSGAVSIVSTFEDGDSVEVGMVGNEGMFGVCVFLGSIATPLEAIVQIAGDGLRMRADVLKAEFKKGGQLQDLLLRYTQAFLTQIAQGAACNRAHDVGGRLAKWLLMSQDRAHSKELGVTHEFISQMLGVRRAGVTEAAGQLKQAGLISNGRGNVTIIDREGLEAASCECYLIMKKEFVRLLSGNGHTL
jgi:CRP-like cAMP-binding protein